MNASRFTAADGDSTAVNGAFQRIAKRRRADKLDNFAWHKTHFTQA